MDKIDFKTTVIKLAQEFGAHGSFPAGDFGEFLRPMFMSRMEKISRQTKNN